MANVTTEQFANLIAKSLGEYAENIEEAIEKTIVEVGEESTENLKNNPNVPEQTGEYKDGFYTKNIYKGRGKKKGSHKIIVANKKYRLTHLLENGHATRNGGRTKVYPHWRDAQKVADTLPERIEEAIENATK